MQDIHSASIGGSGSSSNNRLFGGGGGGGDRRLRPHHHHGHLPQALKCPRCESVNTKFCYYNNYNLSQPRHFCKNCRRYWTKGGVLRNVPVGGGCRKTKRSKPKSGSHKNASSGERKPSNSHNSHNSSSESSSLTATTATAANTTGTRSVPAPVVAAEVVSVNYPESSTGYFPPLNNDNNNIFSEIGTFTGLITSSTTQLPLGFDISPFRLDHSGHMLEESNSNQQQWMHTDHTVGDELKVSETGPLGFIDVHTTTTEFSGLPEKTTGFGAEDWNNGTDQALFDLTGTVDQSYWSQTQWDDHDGHDHDHVGPFGDIQ